MKTIRNIFSREQVCMPLANIQGAHVRKYRSFKSFLTHNHSALKSIAEMEQLYYSGKPFDLVSVRGKYETLLESLLGSIYTLESLSERTYSSLEHILYGLDTALSEVLKPRYSYPTQDIVLPFERITPATRKMVGAKAANLAFIRNSLGFPVPCGFAITAYAFERFMEENRLFGSVERELSRISPESLPDIEGASGAIQAMIGNADIPVDIKEAIIDAYHAIEEKACEGVSVAMRSSAIGEDTEATFAGQYTTVLSVTESTILDAYKTVLASKYSPKAISYRLQHGLDDRETPMCVMGIAMIDARSSGVLYTASASLDAPGGIRISSLWGLGEQLVDGSGSPDTFVVERGTKTIVERHISIKERRLISLRSGGTLLEEVPEDEKEIPSLADTAVIEIARYGMMLEKVFGAPQDVEWALDKKDTLFILQSRPLHVLEKTQEKEDTSKVRDYPVLFSGGAAASYGIAMGKVFKVSEGEHITAIPENGILVAKTASPAYAEFVGKVNGIITDIGSITSHLSSVAREFGVPAIVDAKNATTLLSEGELITMSASATTVYKGIIEELITEVRAAKRLVFESPVHLRMRSILDRISPLNLTDPESPDFTPEGCKTFHDIIRFTHEQAMSAMFGLTEEVKGIRSVRLNAPPVPLFLHLIDLGGGLRGGLTTCDTITPEHINSLPLKALWKGFTHPGISREGTVNLNTKNLMTLFASGALSEFGEMPDSVSYAIISGEYMNLSAKLGYHFATVDTLCGENSNQNYLSFQFSGGAGNYYGRSLRISFLGNVLKRLGFQTSLKGDLMEAFVIGYDRASMEETLDQIGRLLASSRLLDMGLSNQSDVERFTELFFNRDYDFLSRQRDDQLKEFYTHGGYWKREVENGHAYCVQDGSRAGLLTSGLAGVVGKVIGATLQEFLDTVEAYYYFPLAIVKDREFSEGAVSVRIKPVSGHIDRAGGIAFGLQNANNYFVLRINALEDNLILFEYINNKRIQRVTVKEEIKSGSWYQLTVEIKDKNIKGYLDGRLVIEYSTDKPLKGFVGLWTKADSVTHFDDLVIRSGGQQYEVAC